MTGPEHYREAERIMREMSIIEDGRTQEVALSEAMAAAQVHAILALAGATGVEARGADGQAWTEVAGVPRGRLPATTALGAGAVGGARWRAGPCSRWYPTPIPRRPHRSGAPSAPRWEMLQAHAGRRKEYGWSGS